MKANNLPDIAASFSLSKCHDLIAASNHQSIFVTSLQYELNREGGNKSQVVREIVEQIRDNEPLVRHMFGDELVDRLKAIYPDTALDMANRVLSNFAKGGGGI